MVEKRKNDMTARSPQRTGAVILIIIGILFLLMNAGAFSFGDVGEFFGNLGRVMGEFFGGFGRAIGEFFGNLGGSIGALFGNLGRALANFWPLVLILIGLVLLFWRRPARQDEG